MIIDMIENISIYKGISKTLDSAIEYIEAGKLSATQAGRHEISNDGVYANVFELETKAERGGQLEAHRSFIDIHVPLSGSEIIYYANIRSLPVVKEYDKDTDCVFFNGESTASAVLDTGSFAICFPQDGHIAGIALDEPQKIVKSVVKVKA